MKFITILLFVTFLASCTAQNVEQETTTTNNTSEEITLTEMDDAM